MRMKLQVDGLVTPWRAVAIAAAVFALILGSLVMIVMTLSEIGNAPKLIGSNPVTIVALADCTPDVHDVEALAGLGLRRKNSARS